jgi:hypothetical protein
VLSLSYYPGPTITIPRHHAIRVAELERDSLLMRAREGGPCRLLWIEAARIADGAVRALREGRDQDLVREMYAIGTGWMRAARCRGWKTPLDRPGLVLNQY